MNVVENRLELEIWLNQVRQRVIGVEDAVGAFSSLAQGVQKTVLQTLSHMALQAKPEDGDVALAIASAKLKPTFTPCVLLESRRLNEAIAKALQLPCSEYEKLFRLLLALHDIADKRRLDSCGEGCQHWWHADLADTPTLDEIRREYARGTL
jgi:hypothetical protein